MSSFFLSLIRGGRDIFALYTDSPPQRYKSILRNKEVLYRASPSVSAALRNDARRVGYDMRSALIKVGVLSEDDPCEWTYPVVSYKINKDLCSLDHVNSG
jgi:hypothetical protein